MFIKKVVKGMLIVVIAVLSVSSASLLDFTENNINFDKKEVQAAASTGKYVIPSGKPIGIKLYTDGLLIVNISEVIGKDNCIYTPAKDSGLKMGDRIISIDGYVLVTNEDFSEYIDYVKRPVCVTVKRENESFETTLNPILSKEGYYRVGMWIRDSTAGIGTMTYYDPSSGVYAALGHPICDADTKKQLTLREGNITSCDIMSVKKGECGIPGELCGSFSAYDLGDVTDNNEFEYTEY